MPIENPIRIMYCPEGHLVTVEDFNLLPEGSYSVVSRTVIPGREVDERGMAFYKEGYMCFPCDRTYLKKELRESNDEREWPQWKTYPYEAARS